MEILLALLSVLVTVYARRRLTHREPQRPGDDKPGIAPAPERDVPADHASIPTEGAVLPPRSGEPIDGQVVAPAPDSTDPWGDILFGKRGMF